LFPHDYGHVVWGRKKKREGKREKKKRGKEREHRGPLAPCCSGGQNPCRHQEEKKKRKKKKKETEEIRREKSTLPLCSMGLVYSGNQKGKKRGKKGTGNGPLWLSPKPPCTYHQFWQISSPKPVPGGRRKKGEKGGEGRKGEPTPPDLGKVLLPLFFGNACAAIIQRYG